MVKLYLFFSGILFPGIAMLTAQGLNSPVPPVIPPYQFVLHDSTAQGYYLSTPFKFGVNTLSPKPAVILDSKGFVVWYMPVDARNITDFKFEPRWQMYQFVRFLNQQQAEYIVLDSIFNPVDSFTTANGILPDSHDFQITDDGTFLLAGASDTVLDLSAYLFNGVPGSANTRVIGFVVQEFDEDHNLLFQWDSNDHIPPTSGYAFYGYNPGGFDYCHGNSIEEDSDGNLLLSFRHLNAVYKIDRQTGKVLWQLGGKTSSFTFSNDPGFSGQHDARRLPNGNIALFDNANMAAPPRISRAVEYELDTINWVATKVWEYKYVPGFFSRAMAGHQTTPERLHAIGYGLVFRPNPSAVLVDDAGNLVSELFFADSVMSYRSYYYDNLPLAGVQRPSIQCSQNSGTVTLTAPPGYGQYVWSTGETAKEINIQESGAYQVWVNYGAGMLGSEPFFVQDINMACPISNVKNINGIDNQTIIGYFDLLGRRITRPEYPEQAGKIYLVQYADGRSKLMVNGF
ncbi:MAG: arylsulfotransferase family protein [Thermoanaerobaculia bacterium]|nr:arylsulfotransferase family protein [Thermoanaerobaculia bacterium]